MNMFQKPGSAFMQWLKVMWDLLKAGNRRHPPGFWGKFVLALGTTH